MSKHLALYTFGVFTEHSEHPANDGFHAVNDPILDLVDRAPGLIARSGYDDEPGPPCWGVQVYPRFYEERGDGWSPSTLSLWQDMESAMAFSYSGLHASALKQGRDWFSKPQWPPYAAWQSDCGRPEKNQANRDGRRIQRLTPGWQQLASALTLYRRSCLCAAHSATSLSPSR